MLPLDVAAYGTLSPNEREAVARRVRTSLARAYLNLGIMQAQASRFARAAEHFDVAVELDPAFPQGQYLARRGVLQRAAVRQGRPGAGARVRAAAERRDRRMLAMASFNAGDYARAADLLSRDPTLPKDPSLQYAYGVALVRSDRADEAEKIFSRVLAENPDVPELNVVIGQIHAARGDYDAAIASLRRALAIKPDVADANASLGTIYMRQGKLEAAARRCARSSRHTRQPAGAQHARDGARSGRQE